MKYILVLCIKILAIYFNLELKLFKSTLIALSLYYLKYLEILTITYTSSFLVQF